MEKVMSHSLFSKSSIATPGRWAVLSALATMLVGLLGAIAVANEAIAVAFTNAKIVTRPGQVIENGNVVFRNGLIEAVGADIEIPFDAKVIDCEGMVIYAGFIDGGTSKGLPSDDDDGRQTGSGLDRRDIDLATQIAASTREVNRKGVYPDYSSSRHITIDDDNRKDWYKAGIHISSCSSIRGTAQWNINCGLPRRIRRKPPFGIAFSFPILPPPAVGGHRVAVTQPA